MRKVCAFATVVLASSVAFGQQAQPQAGGQRIGVQGTQPQAQPGQPGTAGQRLQQGQQGVGQSGAGQQIRPGQQGFAQQGQAGQQAGNTDQQIAAVIYDMCHNEVETAKFAQSKLQTQEAKQFADRMIKDHSPECETYQRMAGNLATGRGNQNRAAGGQHAGGPLDWVSIHHQIGRQCLESTQKELSQHQGQDFDKGFMGQQLAAHMHTKDTLSVLKQHASQQLAQQIDQSLEGVESHLKEARQIMEQLKDRPSERVSRRPEGSK